tara:strand:- start:10614 stop:11966 length:1353 start_codon:yes stop_codon:yes gene_type:complete
MENKLKSVAEKMWKTRASNVRESLSKSILVDGYHLVLDLEKSKGSILVDASDNKEYIDLFSMFASQPIGVNHESFLDDDFLLKLGVVGSHKPVNSDVYTQPYADFVTAMSRVVTNEYPHLFFIEGGSLAVENALKVAFDWKMRKNLESEKEVHENLLSIAHLEKSFHGRSGYTLSLTNTADPRKTMFFPKFDWPRLPCPSRTFPETESSLASLIEKEKDFIDKLDSFEKEHPNQIAAVLMETIQGEGGDNHFRNEFLAKVRSWCDSNDVLLIFDEVQVGMGITGNWWAWQGTDVKPDIFSFGKKSQVCGIAASSRIDDVDNCFKVSSRINSTWGGNLVDMVRVTKYIEIIEKENLLDNCSQVGAFLLQGLKDMAKDFDGLVSNVRGAGLMCAFDLPNEEIRDTVRSLLVEEGVLILGCGDRSLRFRPVLDVSKDVIAKALNLIRKVLNKV